MRRSYAERRIRTALSLAAGLIWVATLSAQIKAPDTRSIVVDSTLLGEFRDDYGEAYVISPTLWTQLPRTRYRIVSWNPAEQYLIAQNDSGNTSAPRRWTRIDWLTLPGVPSFTWAFCLSAYKAPTRAAAESTTVANRSTPKTGCNGYPFSRMRRPRAGETPHPSAY